MRPAVETPSMWSAEETNARVKTRMRHQQLPPFWGTEHLWGPANCVAGCQGRTPMAAVTQQRWEIESGTIEAPIRLVWAGHDRFGSTKCELVRAPVTELACWLCAGRPDAMLITKIHGVAFDNP